MLLQNVENAWLQFRIMLNTVTLHVMVHFHDPHLPDVNNSYKNKRPLGVHGVTGNE